MCWFMLHLRSGIGGFRDCGHIRLLLKEIRDSARISPARVQCPFQGRSLYEASCGVSPVLLPRAPDPASLGVRRWHGPAGPLGLPPERGPLCRTGQVHFHARCPLAPARPHDVRWPFKPKPTVCDYTTTVL